MEPKNRSLLGFCAPGVAGGVPAITARIPSTSTNFVLGLYELLSGLPPPPRRGGQAHRSQLPHTAADQWRGRGIAASVVTVRSGYSRVSSGSGETTDPALPGAHLSGLDDVQAQTNKDEAPPLAADLKDSWKKVRGPRTLPGGPPWTGGAWGAGLWLGGEPRPFRRHLCTVAFHRRHICRSGWRRVERMCVRSKQERRRQESPPTPVIRAKG